MSVATSKGELLRHTGVIFDIHTVRLNTVSRYVYVLEPFEVEARVQVARP